MFKLDLTKKNAAISILFTLDITYLVLWLILGLHGLHQDMSDKLWTLFFGTNTGLMLIINTEAKREAGLEDHKEISVMTPTGTLTQETTIIAANPTTPANPA